MSFMGNHIGQKALTAHSRQRYDEALALYQEADKKGMDRPAALRGYGALLVRLGRYDEALDVLKRADAAPGQTPAQKTDILVHYAIVLWKKGHLDHAIELLRDQLGKTQNGELYSVLCYLLIEQGDAEAALALCQEALEYDENDAIFQDNMGQALYRLQGEKAAARPYFERALALKPAAIDTNYFLALMDVEAGETSRAKERLLIAQQGNATPLNYAQPERIRAVLDAIR